jgi:hypothetical protein
MVIAPRLRAKSRNPLRLTPGSGLADATDGNTAAMANARSPQARAPLIPKRECIVHPLQ